MLAVSAFGMCGLGSQQELILKGVQVVLVWKYSESEEEPRPPNITLRTARAYAASDRSWRPVRSSSSHIEPPLIYDNREHYWGPPAPLGALGGLWASWFGLLLWWVFPLPDWVQTRIVFYVFTMPAHFLV